MLRIDLLGPLEISARGRIIHLTAPKPRQVLALLALSANSIVRNEQFMEELWEDKPPTSASTTLQTYIYQLRKCLNIRVSRGSGRAGKGPLPDMLLHTYANGYMLSLAEDALDTLRFERMVQRGRELLDADSAAEAAHLLREALALWHGPALVDVNYGLVLRAEVIRLEEIRRSAIEARIDAELLLGRQQALLSDLMKLTAQNPTHEGFQARLMLALYRSGRRSEALQVFRRARNALVTELGVEPSVKLQQLHQAILVGKVQLDYR